VSFNIYHPQEDKQYEESHNAERGTQFTWKKSYLLLG